MRNVPRHELELIGPYPPWAARPKPIAQPAVPHPIFSWHVQFYFIYFDISMNIHIKHYFLKKREEINNDKTDDLTGRNAAAYANRHT